MDIKTKLEYAIATALFSLLVGSIFLFAAQSNPPLAYFSMGFLLISFIAYVAVGYFGYWYAKSSNAPGWVYLLILLYCWFGVCLGWLHHKLKGLSQK